MSALRWVNEMIEVYFYSEGASEHGQKEFAHEVNLRASELSRHTRAQHVAEYCPVGCRLAPTQQAKLEVLILFGYVSPNALLDQCAEVDGGLIPGLALATNLAAMPGGRLTRRAGKCDSRMELAAAMYLARRLGAPVNPEFASRALMGPLSAQWLANLSACHLEGKYQTVLQKMMSVYQSELQDWINGFAYPGVGEDCGRAALTSYNNFVCNLASRDKMNLASTDVTFRARLTAIERATDAARSELDRYTVISRRCHELSPARKRNTVLLAGARAQAELRALADMLECPIGSILETARNTFDSSQDMLAMLDISREFVEATMAIAAPAATDAVAQSAPDAVAQSATDAAAAPAAPLIVAAAQSAPVIAAPAATDAVAAQSATDAVAQSATDAAAAPAAPLIVAAAQSAPVIDTRGVLEELVALLEQLRGQLAAGK